MNKKPIIVKKELSAYSPVTTKKNILNQIPDNYSHGVRRFCKNCNDGDGYTCRIRMRVGKEVMVNTGSYSKEKYKTRQQLQIICGSFCVQCGDFEEDKDFVETRIKNLKSKLKDGWAKKKYKQLLKDAENKKIKK